jgi:hypothetical protein
MAAGGATPTSILDLYKLSVEMADRVSARRGAANNFFLTVQTALVTVLGALDEESWVAPAAGIVLSVAWWRLLLSYRDLNRAKFTAIDHLERQLPARPLADEWAALHPAGDTPSRLRRYTELGAIERLVPWIFAALYVALLLGA